MNLILPIVVFIIVSHAPPPPPHVCPPGVEVQQSVVQVPFAQDGRLP